MKSQEESHQYYPVILEIGSRLVRSGFAGDAAPLSTLQINDPIFNFKVRKHEEVENEFQFHNDNDLSIVYEDISAYKQQPMGPVELKLRTQISEYYNNDLINKKWLFDQDILLSKQLEASSNRITENLLERILYHIYVTDLLVDAKRCKVIIPFPVLWPIHIKRSIANVLLDDIHAQSIIFLPDAILSVLSAGTKNGLVVDLGWDQVTVSPVYDEKLIYKNIKMTNRGSGKDLHYHVLQMLLQNSDKIEGLDFANKDTVFEFIENFINEAVYCHPLNEGLPFIEHEDSLYTCSDGVKVPSVLRNYIIEELYFPPENKRQYDDSEEPLIPLLNNIILNLAIDLRQSLANRIIFTGHLSKVPGLKTRILQELRQENKDLTFKSIVSLGSWSGASLYCSTKLMASASNIKNQELVRDDYLQGKANIPDWIDHIYQLK